MVVATLVALVRNAPAAQPSRGRATIYPAPAGVAADPEYRVFVDGKPVFVYANPSAAIASFDFDGTVDVRIEPHRDPKWVDVRPLSRGVRATIEDGAIRFALSKPGNFSVELNADPNRHPLFLFANPMEKNPPKPGAKGVRYFGPGKVHQAGLIEPKDGETIYIAGGAVVQGAIEATGVKNVKIMGRGILDGTRHNELFPRSGGRWVRFVGFRDCRDVTVEGITLSNGQTWELVPMNCDGVHVRNVKIVSDNGGDDGIDIVRSRDVTIEDSFVRTKDDCIAVKSFGPWARPGAPPPPPDPHPDLGVERVHVTRSVFWNAAWGNALEVGFELRLPVRDVRFTDSDIIHVDNGAAMSIHQGDAGDVSNIRFENIRVEDSTQKLFDVAIFLTQYSSDRPADAEVRKARYLHGAWDGVLSVPAADREMHAARRGHVRGVVFKDIQILDGKLPFSIFEGFDEAHAVEDVVIENLTLRGQKLTTPEAAKLRLRHAAVRFAD